MIDIINEYILILHGTDTIYRVYAHNEQLAIRVFEDLCEEYADVKDEESKKHWESLLKAIMEDRFTLIKNDDFKGVRAIV